MGAAARAPAKDGRSDHASRAPDPRVSGERGGARGAPGAGAREGSDSEIVKRRAFVKTVSRLGGWAVSADLMGYYPSTRLPVSPSLLIPMDDAQSDHLKAYGVAYRVVQAGIKAEWLLNYRGGSFLLPDGEAIRRDAALGGVKTEPVDDGRVTTIRGEIEASNMDAVPLEKAPKVAVYVPPNAPPWDDAVTMALQYAGIPFDKVWDPEVIAGRLKEYDWLHLHHEDFTGQYSKFYLIYTGQPWLAEMVHFNGDAARRLPFPSGPQVNAGPRRQPLGAYKLFNFSAKIDPVPTMLVQDHRQVIPDFYGLTTSFLRERLKPGVTVLADEEGAPWVKYIHGDLGKGTWTFFGGHDPEDPQHQIGDPPTDLSLYPHSPGYRLILNNVLFPAAKKRELKT